MDQNTASENSDTTIRLFSEILVKLGQIERRLSGLEGLYRRRNTCPKERMDKSEDFLSQRSAYLRWPNSDSDYPPPRRYRHHLPTVSPDPSTIPHPPKEWLDQIDISLESESQIQSENLEDLSSKTSHISLSSDDVKK